MTKAYRHLLLATTATICALTCTISHASVRFARGTLTPSVSVSVTETSKVAPNANSTSDTIYSFSPSVGYTRDTARMTINANLSTSWRRYEDASYLNSNATSFSLNGDVPYGAGTRFSGTWNLSYFTGIRSDFFSNRNFDSTNYSANLNSSYKLRGKIDFRGGLTFRDRSSSGVQSTFANENRTYGYYVGVHARELVRGRIGTYVDYNVQYRETLSGFTNQLVDDKNDGLRFGITGQILPERLFPKLEADLSIGYYSTTVRNGSRERLAVNGALSYPINQRASVSLTFDKGMVLTDDDRNVEQSNVNLSANYNPRPNLSLTASIGVRSNDFVSDTISRKDDITLSRISAAYSIRRNWQAQISYNLRESSSNFAVSDYNSSQLTLSSSYSF